MANVPPAPPAALPRCASVALPAVDPHPHHHGPAFANPAPSPVAGRCLPRRPPGAVWWGWTARRRYSPRSLLQMAVQRGWRPPAPVFVHTGWDSRHGMAACRAHTHAPAVVSGGCLPGVPLAGTGGGRCGRHHHAYPRATLSKTRWWRSASALSSATAWPVVLVAACGVAAGTQCPRASVFLVLVVRAQRELSTAARKETPGQRHAGSTVVERLSLPFPGNNIRPQRGMNLGWKWNKNRRVGGAREARRGCRGVWLPPAGYDSGVQWGMGRTGVNEYT